MFWLFGLFMFVCAVCLSWVCWTLTVIAVRELTAWADYRAYLRVRKEAIGDETRKHS